ncbi:unnamed protein product [Bursaphelenchus okinawaensis]|uniref:Uncharacterized protein n=1 Tax=Bursaphelenchus okinawaensis TaxID=465554 RepID=A0A811JWK4_9BILA|nr:unnamed protein product [Bursaphelenchus okinawaensis]CAG9086839.1 unnamed protein product [Bursaphelenchus okinawaensis]
MAVSVSGQKLTCGEPSCATYTCLEDIAQCGPNGYLLALGYPNCLAFNEYYDDFDNKGKDFVTCATYCLPEWLEVYFEEHNNTVDCDQLEKDALASHVKCFLDCGFCGMWWNNLITLAKVLTPSDFLNLDVDWTGVKTFFGCATGIGY